MVIQGRKIRHNRYNRHSFAIANRPPHRKDASAGQGGRHVTDRLPLLKTARVLDGAGHDCTEFARGRRYGTFTK